MRGDGLMLLRMAVLVVSAGLLGALIWSMGAKGRAKAARCRAYRAGIAEGQRIEWHDGVARGFAFLEERSREGRRVNGRDIQTAFDPRYRSARDGLMGDGQGEMEDAP
jgi:hypothetical protein